MGLVEVITALAVIGGFVWIIIGQLNKKNPGFIDKMKDLFKDKKKQIPLELQRQQIYPEKRQIM